MTEQEYMEWALAFAIDGDARNPDYPAKCDPEGRDSVRAMLIVSVPS